MRIEITLNGNDYAVDIDASNFTPVAFKVNQDKSSPNYGKRTETNLAFYTKLGNAFQRILREEIASSNETVTLSAFVERYETLNKELQAQFEKLKL